MSLYTDIKPIPTEYDGIRYKSRLEARWAIFLNSLDIPHFYEYEGYKVNGVWYLPDFYLPYTWRGAVNGQKGGQGVTLEIKPDVYEHNLDHPIKLLTHPIITKGFNPFAVDTHGKIWQSSLLACSGCGASYFTSFTFIICRECGGTVNIHSPNTASALSRAQNFQFAY